MAWTRERLPTESYLLRYGDSHDSHGDDYEITLVLGIDSDGDVRVSGLATTPTPGLWRAVREALATLGRRGYFFRHDGGIVRRTEI